MDGVIKQDSIFVRINKEDKKEIESICNDMGITPATAAKMFFKQLIKDRVFPFTPKACDVPWAMKTHDKKEIIQALLDSEEEVQKGEVLTEKEFHKLTEAI